MFQMKARILEENEPSFIEKYILRKKHIPLQMDYLDDAGIVQKQQVSVSQAPEPTDVIWKNLHTSDGELRKRSFIGSFLVFLILFICFGMIYFLAKKQSIYARELTKFEEKLKTAQEGPQAKSYRLLWESQKDHQVTDHTELLARSHHYITHLYDNSSAPAKSQNQSNLSEAKILDQQQSSTKIIRLIALIIGITISILNKILVRIMVYITNYQLPFTITGKQIQSYNITQEQNISNATKLSFSMFFNTALQTFLIKVIIPWSLDGFNAAQDAIIEPSGLTVNQNMVILQNVVITNALNIVDISYLMKLISNKMAMRKKGSQTLTKGQLNTVFELPIFTMPENYAFVINTMLLTAFYSPLLPIALFYSLICLFFAYWIYKYQLLNRRTVKSVLGVQLSQSMTNQLELFLPIFCFGNLIFNTMLANDEAANDFSTSNFNFFFVWIQMFYYSTYFGKVGVLIGIIHYFLPTQQINSIIMPLREDIKNSFTYEVAKKENFDANSYETENPVTKEEAMNKISKQNQKRQESMSINKKADSISARKN